MINITITLPDDLRNLVTSFLAGLDGSLKGVPERRGRLEEEIASLHATERELAGEIAALKPSVLEDEAAAGVLAGKERRLVEVQRVLGEKRQALARVEPVNLWPASEVLTEVTKYYNGALSSAIAQELRPVCPDIHRAGEIASMTPAVMALRYIRNWSYTVDTEPATAGNVERLRGILNRALAGKPYLSLDVADELARQ